MPDDFDAAWEKAKRAAGGDEPSFRAWYGDRAKRLGLDPNPDDPAHHYDYRAAFRAGAEPDETGHWPSRFKADDHPNRFIDGVDTKTGRRVDDFDSAWAKAKEAVAVADDPTASMTPEQFRAYTTTNRPRDADEAKRWTERVNREAPELARFTAEKGGKVHDPDTLDKIAAVIASPVTGAVHASRNMAKTYVRLAGGPDTGDEDLAGWRNARREAAEADLRKSTVGDLAMTAGETVGLLPSFSTGTGMLPRAIPALLKPGIVMGAQAGLETGSLKEAGKGFAIGTIGGAASAGLRASLARVAPKIQDALLTRVAEGKLSWGSAQAIVDGIAEGKIDPNAVLKSAVIGGAFNIPGGRGAKPGGRPLVDKPADVADLPKMVEEAKAAPVEAPSATEMPARSEVLAGEPRQPLPTEANPSMGVKPAEKPVEREALPSEPANLEALPEMVKAAAAGEPPVGTSIKNRMVNEARAEMGKEPLEDTPPQSFQGWLDAARKAIAENPNKPAEVMADLKRTGRAHTPTEVAILTEHRVNLNRAVKASDAKVVEAAERGDADAVASAKAESARLRNEDFEASELVGKAAGAEAARGLGARRMVLDDAYELLPMETQRRVENDGRPLTAQQAAETKALHERIDKAIKERDAYAARLAEVEAKRASRGARAAPGASAYGASNKIVTREAYDAAKAELRSKLSSLSAGLDPTLLVPAVKMGVYHLEAGARTFTAWAKRMTDELGDKVTPHLDEVWIASHKEVGVPTEVVGKSDAARQHALETRLTNRAADIEQRVATGNLKLKERTPLARGPRAVELEARVETAKKAWQEALLRDRLARESKTQKVVRTVFKDVPAFQRLWQFGWDFSITGLQFGGEFLKAPIPRFTGEGLRVKWDPLRPFKQFGEALGALGRNKESIRRTAEAEARVTMDPMFAAAKRDGLHFGGIGGTNIEEVMQSRYAEKVPGLRNLQRFVTTLSNRMRLDAYKIARATLSRTGEPTPAEGRHIASMVNIFTGRGGPSHGKAARALDAANTVLLAPRWVLSRFQTILGAPLVHGGSLRTKALVAQEYGRLIAGMGLIYGLAYASGAPVDDDPDSPGFGDININGTKINPTLGLSSVATFLRRAYIRLAGDEKAAKSVSPDFVGRYARTKLNPMAGAGYSIINGKMLDYDEGGVRKDATLGNVAKDLFTPLSINDIYQTMVQQQSVPKGLALGALAVFGARVRNDRFGPGAKEPGSRGHRPRRHR